MLSELSPEAVRHLRVPDVRKYLRATGWVPGAGRRPDIGIFRRPGSKEAEVLLPLRTDFVDFDDGMARAVAEIARFEARPASQVLRDLLRPRADVLRFAAESRETADGGIKLDDGLSLLSGSKKALLAAACSAERPQPFHPRMSLREAEAFVSGCRLGQTEQGSFVVTLECQLDVEETLPLFEPGDAQEPFGRKATALLMRSVARVIEAVQADDLGLLTRPSPPPVSANLCEAILEMMPSAEDAALRVASSWSPVVPPPKGIPAVVRVERQYTAAIAEIARVLRPTEGPAPDLFVGKVDALLRRPEHDGDAPGEIVLAAQVEDAIVKMRVELGAEEYKRAGVAHLEDRYVSVRGVLRRGARVHRLEGATGFTLVG